MEMLGRRVVDLFHRVQKHVALQRDVAHPDQIRLGILDARRNGTKVAVTEFPLQKQHLFQTAFFSHFPCAQRHEVN